MSKIVEALQTEVNMLDCEVVGNSNLLRLFQGQLSRRNGVLVRDSDHGMEVLVPRQQIPLLLSRYHDDPTSGHCGRLWWPTINKDIADWTASCNICQRKQTTTHPIHATMQPIVSTAEPFQFLSIDILCGLPTTERGTKFILVVTDYATRWPKTFALPDDKAETVARKLTEEVFFILGLPSRFHSDLHRNLHIYLFTPLFSYPSFIVTF